MKKRTHYEQNIHDREIAKLGFFERLRGNWVCTNPDGKRNCYVERRGRKVYPDLLVGKNGRINRLIEVETESSVTEDEARNQWVVYAEGPSTLQIHVPRNKESVAKALIRKFRIRAMVTTY